MAFAGDNKKTPAALDPAVVETCVTAVVETLCDSSTPSQK